jgi:hypothetical protein
VFKQNVEALQVPGVEETVGVGVGVTDVGVGVDVGDNKQEIQFANCGEPK